MGWVFSCDFYWSVSVIYVVGWVLIWVVGLVVVIALFGLLVG